MPVEHWSTQAAWLDDRDLRDMPWKALELGEGESISGKVLRLPRPGAFLGRQVFIATVDDVFGLDASSKGGHAVLEHQLRRTDIAPGDNITIHFVGWRTSAESGRRYRDFKVRRS